MILREGDKVRKTENGIVYEVKKIHDKGFVILRSEDGSRTALMDMKAIGLYFTLVSTNLAEAPIPSYGADIQSLKGSTPKFQH
jgi:hypothetical protein